jgi:hypothetical protein
MPAQLLQGEALTAAMWIWFFHHIGTFIPGEWDPVVHCYRARLPGEPEPLIVRADEPLVGVRQLDGHRVDLVDYLAEKHKVTRLEVIRDIERAYNEENPQPQIHSFTEGRYQDDFGRAWADAGRPRRPT